MIDLIAQAQQSTFHGTTTLHPVGLAIVLVLGLLTLMLPRRWAFMPFLIMACFVAPGQRLVIATLDFNFLRILVLFAWLRVTIRREYVPFRFMPIDAVLILWAMSSTLIYTIEHGSGAAFINRLGQSYDALGTYFYLRWVIRDWTDIKRFVIGIGVISVPVMFAFALERATARNMFSVFGGVPAITAERNGRLRCQGAFAHPILAGCFWAAMLPIIISGWWMKGSVRGWSLCGAACAFLIIFFCASSTPVAAVIFGTIGAAMFPLRHHLRWVRYGVLFMMVVLHFVMNKPLWHLVSRVDIVGGSTGWHRYYLIDQAINRLPEWWLTGTRSTGEWGRGLQDVTNQYVLEGVRGGLLSLILFVISIALAFRGVGRILQSCEANRSKLIIAWALGVSLLIHATSFISVSYFGQLSVLWYFALAVPTSLAATVESHRSARSRREMGVRMLSTTQAGDSRAQTEAEQAAEIGEGVDGGHPSGRNDDMEQLSSKE